MDQPRLNKFLATRLAMGRRQADDLITKGQVTVNGIAARLGQRIGVGDAVAVKGKLLAAPGNQPLLEYVALHKPIGYVCSRRQQGGTPTIYALLPKQYQHLKPVGRLDKDSSGLLLLTNDGDFAQKLTHPRYGKRKIYHVQLNKPLQPLHRQLINDHGLDLPDGPSRLALARLQEHNDTFWEVTIHEGRNRQIRRTFAALSYTVTTLHRVQLGAFSLGSLRPGRFEIIHPHQKPGGQ